MSRMIVFACVGLLVSAGSAAAQGHYPAGQKPFHPPKSPKPAGILADTCFGHFPTRWTTWCTACVSGPCGPACAPTPGSAVVIFDATPAKPAEVKATPLPAPAPKK